MITLSRTLRLRLAALTVLAAVAALAALSAATLGAATPALAQPAGPRPPAGTWRSYGCTDCVVRFAVTDDAVWAGSVSGGGVVRHDRRTGEARVFDRDDGLGGASIVDIAAAPDGHVWVATRLASLTSSYTGVSRWDGARWTAFQVKDPRANLPLTTVLDVAAGPGGTAWIAAIGGAAFYDGNTWTTHLILENLWAIAFGVAGEAWAGGAGGLWHYDGRAWSAVDMTGLPSTAFNDIAVHPNGDVWVAVGNGIGQHRPQGFPDGSRWRFTPMGWSGEGNGWNTNIDDLYIDGRGRVVALHNRVVHRFDGAAWTTNDAAALRAQQVKSASFGIAITEDDEVWVGHQTGGISHWDGQAWSTIVTELGPSNLVGFALAIDGQDRVWTGLFPMLSPGNYLNRFDGARWQRFDVNDGLPRLRSPFAMFQNGLDVDATGTVWVSIDGAALAWYDGRAWTSRVITDVVGSAARVYSVRGDDRGGAWLGTMAGAVHFDGRSGRRFTTADGLASDRVNAVAIDRRGGSDILWFGTDKGVTRWDGTTWRTFTTADGLAADQVFSIEVDPIRDTVWVASGINGFGGISRYDGRSWRVYTKAADGLGAMDAWTMAVAPNGDLWVAWQEDNAPNGPGIGRFVHATGRWVNYSVQDGLIDGHVFSVAVDSQGTVWAATLGGVSAFTPPDILPEPTPTPAGPCVCQAARERAPATAIDAALARPDAVEGYRQPLDPGKPVGPFNPLRECLSLRQPGAAYHPLYNGLTWRAGCP